MALAILLSGNGHEVILRTHNEKKIEELNSDRKHIENLPGAVLPDNVRLTCSLDIAMENPDMVVFTVASPYFRKLAADVKPYMDRLIERKGKAPVIVSVSKGIENGTLLTLDAVIEQEIPGADVAILSGPSHAEEVSIGIPTTVVAGAAKMETANFVQDAFMNEYFRVYTSPDVIGIEIGGALKNVIALAAGVADGLGFGDNTKAALMTRGITEIARLGEAMGGKLATFAGLSGVGDLFVTCTSKHSRNRNAGYLIGTGKSMEEAMKEVNQVVEGVNSAKAALALAKKYNVSMPIVEQINKILFDGKNPSDAVKDLLLRDKTQETLSISW